jgi:hypothetical protein
MTMSTKVQIPTLVNIMLTCQRKELKMAKGSTCNCSQTMCKPTSHAMVTKVPMRSLPWAQCKRWIPIGSMGCVHAH